MNVFNEITDEEFVPFLNNLGVDTYKKSFEWLLNDSSDFKGALRWLYDNFDQTNALSTREQYRYTEIQKKGALLSSVDLEVAIQSILNQYEGIPLPGDQATMDDVKLDIEMQKERLKFIENQEKVITDLIEQNNETTKYLNCEFTKLNATRSQLEEDESVAYRECEDLALETENITTDVVQGIADTFDLFSKCYTDKEVAKMFPVFGLFEPYRHTQALFRSHVDLYTVRKFKKKQNENGYNEEEFRKVLISAKDMEERLYNAIYEYINMKVELNGDQAMLRVVETRDVVHPNDITRLNIEARTSVALLEQEEMILHEQLKNSIQGLVVRRTRLAEETAIRAALAVRKDVLQSLCHLESLVQSALLVDRVLLQWLRRAHSSASELLHLAAEVAHHVRTESAACHARIESMKAICKEQNLCMEKLQSEDMLLRTLSDLLGISPTSEAKVLVKASADLDCDITSLKQQLEDVELEKRSNLKASKQLQQPLIEYIWDGCTKQPNFHNRAVAALKYTLMQDMANVEKKVVDTGKLFTSVKSGDKQKLRKYWQWFLTDPARFHAANKDAQSKGHW